MRCLFAGRLRGRRWGRLSALPCLWRGSFGSCGDNYRTALERENRDPKLGSLNRVTERERWRLTPRDVSGLSRSETDFGLQRRDRALIQAIPAWGSAIAINRRQRFRQPHPADVSGCSMARRSLLSSEASWRTRVSPTGKYLFVNSQLFVLETGEQIGDFGQNVGSFSHDSRFLATGIAVWNLDHGQLVWDKPSNR